MGVMGVYRGMGVYLRYLREYGCSWVFGCKSKATGPMKNRRCEEVVTVDLSSCVCIGVYGCSWVFGCKSKATCPMKNRRCEGVVTVDLPSI